MRIPSIVFARALATALLVLACKPGLANLFGNGKQSIPPWGLDAAKTPTPSYDTDAAAVILFDEYVETVDAQGRAVEREREAIRILKPQDRNTTCEVSYDVNERINYFRVWTIAADGNQYQAKDTEFTEEGDTGIPSMLSTRKVRIAHPPAIDVGAVEICESEELLEPYMREDVWQFQHSIPAVFQALEVDLPGGRVHAQAWHNYKPIQPIEVAPNHWRWEIRDVHALNLRDVHSAPAWEALAARMSVQWGDAAVEGTDNQWRAIGQWVTKLEADRPDPSPEITAQVQTLIAGTNNFYTRLSRITDFIQKNIRYFIVIRGIGGLQANPAADIFRNRFGDCKDKATLLISMLQIAGIHAFYMPVDDRRGVVDPGDPSLLGDHMITAIEIPPDVQDPRLMAIVKAKDGMRYLLFDPTDERTPVGNLPSELQGGYGLLAAGPASQIMALPVLAADANGSERKGVFTLSSDGTLTGSVDSTSIGPKGADLRSFLKYTDEKERREYWERSVAESLPGVTLDAFEFTQPVDLDKPLEFHYKVTAQQYAHQAGSLLLVRPRVVGSYARAFDSKPRIYPINLYATGRWNDSFDITLPPGYVVDETPDPAAIDLDFASYHSSVTAKGNLLHYERDYVIRQIQIPPTSAGAFRHLESVILADENGVAVLKKQ